MRFRFSRRKDASPRGPSVEGRDPRTPFVALAMKRFRHAAGSSTHEGVFETHEFGFRGRYIHGFSMIFTTAFEDASGAIQSVNHREQDWNRLRVFFSAAVTPSTMPEIFAADTDAKMRAVVPELRSRLAHVTAGAEGDLEMDATFPPSTSVREFRKILDRWEKDLKLADLTLSDLS